MELLHALVWWPISSEACRRARSRSPAPPPSPAAADAMQHVAELLPSAVPGPAPSIVVGRERLSFYLPIKYSIITFVLLGHFTFQCRSLVLFSIPGYRSFRAACRRSILFAPIGSVQC
ncbi:unnamed protein product [Urochloa humidicola]